MAPPLSILAGRPVGGNVRSAADSLHASVLLDGSACTPSVHSDGAIVPQCVDRAPVTGGADLLAPRTTIVGWHACLASRHPVTRRQRRLSSMAVTSSRI